MLRTRVIPCLLLQNGGLVKTTRFTDAVYVGDPLNAVKIFNDKQVDELYLLDISATRQGRPPDLALLRGLADEASMPLAYGGGITTADQVRDILAAGVEKVVIHSAAAHDRSLLRRAADLAGSQSVIAAVDVRDGRGTRTDPIPPADYAREAEQHGAGEILVNSVDRDGTRSGYDLDLIRRISSAVSIPVIALGGAGSVSDLAAAVKRGGASAAAAGSLFLFHGRHRAVLISYPDRSTLDAAFAP